MRSNTSDVGAGGAPSSVDYEVKEQGSDYIISSNTWEDPMTDEDVDGLDVNTRYTVFFFRDGDPRPDKQTCGTIHFDTNNLVSLPLVV